MSKQQLSLIGQKRPWGGDSGVTEMLFLDLGVGYMDVFALLSFTQLYT